MPSFQYLREDERLAWPVLLVSLARVAVPEVVATGARVAAVAAAAAVQEDQVAWGELAEPVERAVLAEMVATVLLAWSNFMRRSSSRKAPKSWQTMVTEALRRNASAG